MRRSTLAALGAASTASVQAGPLEALAHAGLFFERCAPLELEGPDVGRIEPEMRDVFLNMVAAIPEPPLYASAYIRWVRALAASGAVACEVTAASRVLIGHGNASSTEVGMTLHQVYGVPFLPGTALKGLLNHYMAELGPQQSSPDSSEWRGVRYDGAGRPVAAPGTFHGTMFGAPKLASVPSGEGRQGTRGAAVFEDALYVPGSAPAAQPLMRDVLTPHQFAYYRDGPKGLGNGPTDWDEPNPVSFLSIRPGARFLLAATPVRGGQDVAELALRHLVDAVSRWGVGAKTRAGYGRLTPETEIGPADILRRISKAATQSDSEGEPGARSRAIEDLSRAVHRVLEPKNATAAPPITQRFRAELSGAALNRLLRALSPSESAAALEIIEPLTRHAALMDRFGDQIEQIRSRIVSGGR